MLTEQETFAEILKGKSLARFGDGEIWLLHGKNALRQKHSKKLQDELTDILWNSPALVAIPHANGFRADYWAGFQVSFPLKTNPRRVYGSSFISRPDEARPFPLAPSWSRRNVTLVTGGGSFSPEQLKEADSVTLVQCPDRDAYEEIDALEEQVKTDLAILCCGATATCLADRLTKKGIQALDYGYRGRFE